MVEDGYEFFAKRQLVTLFSAPNYCGEFDNAGGMMSVDETLMCSFQVRQEMKISVCLPFPSFPPLSLFFEIGSPTLAWADLEFALAAFRNFRLHHSYFRCLNY